MNKGWECPRCGKIHAPFKLSCDCVPLAKNATTYQCNHSWVGSNDTSGNNFQWFCINCGSTKKEFETYNVIT
jgi:rubredoxin